MLNFEEFKAKKEGKVTVEGLLSHVLDEADSIEQVIYIALDKNGYVLVGHSHSDSSLKTLGLIEAGKANFIESLRE